MNVRAVGDEGSEGNREKLILQCLGVGQLSRRSRQGLSVNF